MQLSKDERRALRDMALTQGAEILLRLLEVRMRTKSRDLAVSNFANLLDVGRLQGEITACEWIKNVLRRAAEEDEK